jgi:hypothetical protein
VASSFARAASKSSLVTGEPIFNPDTARIFSAGIRVFPSMCNVSSAKTGAAPGEEAAAAGDLAARFFWANPSCTSPGHAQTITQKMAGHKRMSGVTPIQW